MRDASVEEASQSDRVIKRTYHDLSEVSEVWTRKKKVRERDERMARRRETDAGREGAAVRQVRGADAEQKSGCGSAHTLIIMFCTHSEALSSHAAVSS